MKLDDLSPAERRLFATSPHYIYERVRSDPELYADMDALMRAEKGYPLAECIHAHEAFERLRKDKKLRREIEACVREGKACDTTLCRRIMKVLGPPIGRKARSKKTAP
jgi:hypothetical protein